MRFPKIRLISGIVISLILIAASYPPMAQAVQSGNPADTCTEAELRSFGVAVMNCAGESYGCSTASSVVGGLSGGLASGSKLYILGDSITVRSTNQLNNALPAKGFLVDKINAAVSRAITSPGQSSESGLQAIDNDRTTIQASGAVVIALGTNANGANEKGVTDMIAKVKSYSPSTKIYWVNLFSPGITNKDTFNQILSAKSAELGFSLIDAASANIDVSSDNIHPTSSGSERFAQVIATSLAGAGTTAASASGCVCSSGLAGASKEERYSFTWGYLTVDKKLSAAAAAGLMGNLEAESGINPQNTQNNAPAPDGPEIPIAAIRGSHGYGIAQWTSAGRQEKLVAYAKETNRSTGDLGLQLDFLWKELSESYKGVLAVLQTPGVSLNDASDQVLLRFEIPASVLGDEKDKIATMERRRALGQAIFNTYSGQSTGRSGATTCGASGANIDLVSDDTSSIQCAPNTVDRGVVTGRDKNRTVKFRVCSTGGGIVVNSQLSGSIYKLLQDSTAAGLRLGGGGYRDSGEQINLFKTRCPGVDITTGNCPTVANPGTSNHELGFAIDFSCNGSTIPQSYSAAQNNPCFVWLLANSSKYGLYEYSKGRSREKVASYEAWHWSVDGS